MMRFLPSEEAVDLAESGRKRGQDRVACFLHLRDLCYLHPKVAPAVAIAHMKTLEAAVIAKQATREKQLADWRERAERRQGAERQKAAAEQAKAG